jgi:hypothetical protein
MTSSGRGDPRLCQAIALHVFVTSRVSGAIGAASESAHALFPRASRPGIAAGRPRTGPVFCAPDHSSCR